MQLVEVRNGTSSTYDVFDDEDEAIEAWRAARLANPMASIAIFPVKPCDALDPHLYGWDNQRNIYVARAQGAWPQ